MSRTKGGTVTHRRRKKVLDAAKGYYGSRSRKLRTATQAVDKANQYATPRPAGPQAAGFRALVDQRSNAAVRAFDAEMTPFSRFINRPAKAGIGGWTRFCPILAPTRRLRRHLRTGRPAPGRVSTGLIRTPAGRCSRGFFFFSGRGPCDFFTV